MRTLVTLALLSFTHSARAQFPGAPQSLPPGYPATGMPPGMAATPPPLSKTDVERLIRLMPEMARESVEMQSARPAPANPAMGAAGMEDLHKVEALLKKHGTTFPEFFMQLTTMIATYMILQPQELEKHMPTDSNPEVRRILDDPAVPEADKQALRLELAQFKSQQEAFRAQLGTLATEENKKVVKPYLAKIKSALEKSESLSRAAKEKATKSAKPSAPAPSK